MMRRKSKKLFLTKTQPGYILVLSLIFIALVVMLTTRISNRARLHVGYTKVMIDQEHARMLAFSGLQIAMAQLSLQQVPSSAEASAGSQDKGDTSKKQVGQKDQKGKQATEGAGALWTDKEVKEFIKTVWPYMYRWQEFLLKKETYGVDGVVKICLGSEEGKFDLNQTFDFNEDPKKRKFVGQGRAPASASSATGTQNAQQKQQSRNQQQAKSDASGQMDFQKIYQELFKKITKFVKGKDRFKTFENFLVKPEQFDKIYKNRQNSLYDITEFLNLKGFEGFEDKVFYEPPVSGVNPTIYLTDIFTIFSGKKQISPWFISPSIKKLLQFKEKEGMSITERKKKAEELAKKYKKDMKFPADWNSIFTQLYGIKYENIPKEFKSVLSTKFEPKTFSVLSYGEVNEVSQKIFAIIERKKVKRDKKTVIEFDIKKFYYV